MKKGFTLVELIAVLTILSIIALIVTPNIMVSVQEYKEQAYETEIEAMESAARNFVADNINYVPTANDQALYISIVNLIDGGYFEDNVVDTKNGGYFDDEKHESFVIVSCEVIIDETGIQSENYKYSYEAYTSVEEYIKAKTLEYLNDNQSVGTNQKQISGSDLLDNYYIKQHIYSYDELVKNNDNSIEQVLITSNDKIEFDLEITGKTEDTLKYEYTITNIIRQ